MPTGWTMGQHANWPRRYNMYYVLLKRAQWQSSNNDFPFFGPRQDPKDEKSFVAAPLRDSLSRPLRSSSFGRDARWNLNLGSRFTNRKTKKKRKKKKSKSRKLSAWTTNERNDRSPYMHRISSATFVSKAHHDRDHEIRKIDEQSQRRMALSSIRFSFALDFSNFIPWNRLSRENAPTRSETVTICPALPTYD